MIAAQARSPPSTVAGGEVADVLSDSDFHIFLLDLAALLVSFTSAIYVAWESRPFCVGVTIVMCLVAMSIKSSELWRVNVFADSLGLMSYSYYCTAQGLLPTSAECITTPVGILTTLGIGVQDPFFDTLIDAYIVTLDIDHLMDEYVEET
jgi:uncharacterized membrane protein YeiH